MKKILVIGCPGSGKSTFSRKLNSITKIPLFYLDMLFHKPDKTNYSEEEFDEKLSSILAEEEWILDGNYARTLPVRLAQCDTVFWLDYPLEICTKGIEERLGKPRVDMPWIETEPDEEFIEFVKNFKANYYPEMQRLIEAAEEKEIHRFTSREEANEYLKDLKNREFEERFEFREVCLEEADEVAEIEQICFPPNEACSVVRMKERVTLVPELFLVAVDRQTGKIAGFLNGLATDEDVFRDEFFEDARLNQKDGKNIMILGLDVLPEYRRQGLATELVSRYAKRESERGRKSLILTCLDEKVPMYEKMGFVNLGIANSTWGGEQWNEMRVELER